MRQVCQQSCKKMLMKLAHQALAAAGRGLGWRACVFGVSKGLRIRGGKTRHAAAAMIVRGVANRPVDDEHQQHHSRQAREERASSV